MKIPMPFFYWTVRIIAAIVMLQTLYFKFTAAEESVYIFTMVGMEPWGRIAVGCTELVASLLILINTFTLAGALLAFSLMSGALFMHVTMLGIAVKGDGGYLFFLALVVFICSLIMIYMEREKALMFIRRMQQN
jgi:hypothetical protein